MAKWGVQLIQVAHFSARTENLRAGSLYPLFAKEEADLVQNNKNPGPANPFTSLAAGTILEKAYQVTVQPGRVDFQVGCPDRPMSGPWAWPITQGVALFSPTVEAIIPLLDKLPKANRLAINVTLLRNVGNIAEANEMFSQSVGISNISGALDLGFQLNKQAAASVDDVTLNRIMRFTTSTVEEIEFSTASGHPTPEFRRRYVASLVLDLNTVPGAYEFDPMAASSILRDLAGHAVKLAVGGTVSSLMNDHD